LQRAAVVLIQRGFSQCKLERMYEKKNDAEGMISLLVEKKGAYFFLKIS
jgi:hypothetical protein